MCSEADNQCLREDNRQLQARNDLYAMVINEMSARLDRNTQSGQGQATVTQLRRQPLS
jgi:hypothetical protein